jgi:cysteine desulfurase
VLIHGFAVIYLDHNATTPVTPEVLEAMMPYLTSEWGNPSSSYKFGSKLKGVVEVAREQVAQLIGASGREIVFTSCATESNNAAIHAALKATGKRHVVTSAVEHSSVLNYCMALERSGLVGQPSWLPPSSENRQAERPPYNDGYHVTYLPVDRDGLLKLADLENAITDEMVVVSLLWARKLRRDRW